MAEVVIPVGFGQAVLVWNTTTRPQPISVTLGYEVAGSYINAQANAQGIFAAAVSTATAASAAAASVMTNAWQFTGVFVYERRVAGPLIRGDSTGAPVVGTIVGGGAELVVSATNRITKRTSFVGRQYRGRMYAPYTRLEAGVAANGVIDSTNLVAIRGNWDRFYANLVGDGVDPYLLHSDATIPPTLITSFYAQGVVGTQRRRLNR